MSVATLLQPVRLADDKLSDLIRIQSQYLQDPSFLQQNASADYDQLKQLNNVLFQIPAQVEAGVDDLKLAVINAIEGPPPKLEWRIKDVYPPHALSLPKQDQHSPFEIFDPVRLLQTKQMLGDVDLNKSPLVPSRQNIQTFDDLMRWYKSQYDDQHTWWPPKLENLYYAPNIGLRDDWYTDAVFAQQFFTGTNPSSITLASSDWISAFLNAAGVPQSVFELLKSDASSFYVEDYGYIRESMGASATETLFNDAEGVKHYACSPVALFHLDEEGNLHPVAIIIDYKGSMADSVTIFNQRLDSSDTVHDQSKDWPWRYAKMCVLSADWALHEMILHLTHTHLVEEAIIVAARRAFYEDPEHIVYRLLSPHWDITLALNQLARELLVPNIIAPLAGISLPQTNKFIRSEFTKFDWKGKYIPTDLEKRGFPIDQLGSDKFHNYTYARDMIEMWRTLHHFVKLVLKKDYYPDDAKVAADTQIQAFCAEMRSADGAGMVNFPESIQTLDELVDVVTMAIHIASPQHTAINYLQQYYQTFIPNKPSALYTPLPDTISALTAYTENDVLDALPFGQNKLWLLSAQIPYLLTSEVGEKNNIITYATEASKDNDKAIMKAGRRLLTGLAKLKLSFELHNIELDDHEKTPYVVLAPEKMASSIVI